MVRLHNAVFAILVGADLKAHSIKLTRDWTPELNIPGWQQ